MRRYHYGWIILGLAVVTIMAALGFGRFGYTVILPPMRDALGLSDAGAGTLATGNMVGYLVMSLVSGFLAVRLGRRRMIAVSLLVGAGAMALTGLATSFAGAFAGRLLTGLASAGANVPAMGLLSVWFARPRRGFATGLAVGGSSLGLLLTGLLLPPIMNAAGWRTGWYALAGAAALIAVVVFVLLREKPAELGLEEVGAASARKEEEGQAPVPGHDARGGSLAVLLKNTTLRRLGAIYFLYGFSYLIFSTFFVRYLVAEGGFTLNGAGRLWAGIGAVSFVGGLAWGVFSDRFGRKPAFVISFAVLAVCFFVFGFWKSLPGFILASALFALTAWSVVGVMAAAVGDVMGPHASQAFGLVTFCLGVGQALGPWIGGVIADRTGSFGGAFYIAAGVAASGAALSFFLKCDACRQRRGKA